VDKSDLRGFQNYLIIRNETAQRHVTPLEGEIQSNMFLV